MTPEDLLWAAFEKADNCCADRELDVIDTGGHFESFRMSQVADALRELLTVRSVEELDALPPLTVILDADGVVVRRDPWGEFHDSPRWHPLDGSDHQARDFGLDADEVQLPALVLYRPDWGTP